jgi:hypothetical protein
MYEPVCLAHGIECELTKPAHPWTNSQAERISRAIKGAGSARCIGRWY